MSEYLIRCAQCGYWNLGHRECRFWPHTNQQLDEAEACEKRHQEQSAALFGDKDKIVVTRQQILDHITRNPEP